MAPASPSSSRALTGGWPLAGRNAELTGIAVAVVYFAVAALGVAGPSLRASADAVGDGRVWLLLTSALEPQGRWPLAQVATAALVAAAVTWRQGIGTWWAAVLAGHVGSAIIAYILIWIAAPAGVAGRPDHGVSCVLAAGVGALLLSDVTALRWVAAAGTVALLVVSVGWYDAEHGLAVALGAATAAGLRRARARRSRPA